MSAHNDQNYQVREIAALVKEEFTDCEVVMGQDRKRSTAAIECRSTRSDAGLPGFRCDWDARAGVAQLRTLFDRIDLTSEQFGFRAFTRLEELKYLVAHAAIGRRAVLEVIDALLPHQPRGGRSGSSSTSRSTARAISHARGATAKRQPRG